MKKGNPKKTKGKKKKTKTKNKVPAKSSSSAVGGGGSSASALAMASLSGESGGTFLVRKPVIQNRIFGLPGTKEGQPLPALPLRALHQQDGYSCSGLGLYYSDHLGRDPLRDWAEIVFGDRSDETVDMLLKGNAGPWGIATSPIYDDAFRSKLQPGQACFNTAKWPAEFEALCEAGLISVVPGLTHQAGYYDPMPIVNIHIPLHPQYGGTAEGHGGGGDDDDDDDGKDKIDRGAPSGASSGGAPMPPENKARTGEEEPERCFERGQTVTLVDLVARADLNGKTATVTRFNKNKGRYTVTLSGDRSAISVKPMNLVLQEAGGGSAMPARIAKGVRIDGMDVRDTEDIAGGGEWERVPGAFGVGIPLMAKKLPLSQSQYPDSDMFFAVRLMSEPATGLAPMRWQYGGRNGPCPPILLARADGEPFTSDDWASLDDYLSSRFDEGGAELSPTDYDGFKREHDAMRAEFAAAQAEYDGQFR